MTFFHHTTKHSTLSSTETNIFAEFNENHQKFKDQVWSLKFAINHLCDLEYRSLSLVTLNTSQSLWAPISISIKLKKLD